MGLLGVAPGKFATVHLTPEGRKVLRERTAIRLTKPVEVAGPKRKRRTGDIPCDEELFAKLKDVRRRIADERNVPAFVIFSDATLREMARSFPITPEQFRAVSGVGERKQKDFAEPFTGAIAEHLSAPALNAGN
jgi:ATP-dependent DNA helicase RecQ